MTDAAPAHPRALMPSERASLLDAARGLTAAQSARRRGISVHTVLYRLKHGKAALGANNIAHAVALCMALGEFTAEEVRDLT